MKNRKLFSEETIIVTKYFDVHQDWGVPIPGFFIIASKRKISSINDFNKQESEEFFKLLCKLRKGMKNVLNIKNVYLFQREDTEHGFHVWVFPRFDWMERFGRKIQSVRPIIDYAKENMMNEEIFREVKNMVRQMKDYMK